MKKLVFIFFLINVSVFSQLPNFNMHVLANLNQHITNDTYSGCWGYVANNGREYAILGTHLGTAFIDITDSSDIHEVDFAPTPVSGSGNHWREITVYSHYAYVVTEQSGCGIEIFDLQYLPDSVHLVRRFVPPGYLTGHTISVSGSFLYVNGSNLGGGVMILDVTSNPELPVVRGSLNSAYVHDSRIVNDTIWAACLSNGIRIINAVNKDVPVFITSFFTPPHLATHNCALTSDRRYILTSDETASPTAGTLKIFNIQDRSNITFVTDWRPTNITTSQVHNVEIYGDTAVIAHRSAGVRVLDISIPTAPVEIAWYDTFPQNNNNEFIGSWGVYMFPSRKVICSNKETGLWVLQFGAVTGIEPVSNEIPNSFSLSQNYPNPFNPNSKIKFQIAKLSAVKLSVFDVLGKEVQTLVNEQLKPGTYEVNFDGSNLSSGIYYYKIIAGDFEETKKMVLVK